MGNAVDNIQWPDYQQVKSILLAEGAELTPAEVQGLQFGLICGLDDTDLDNLHGIVMRELSVEGRPTGECQIILRQLLDSLAEFLDKAENSEELVFELPLFIPDEATLSEQANELSCWCKGFLYGLGLSQADLKRLQSEEAQGALQDITQIAKLPLLEGTALDEEDEEDIYSILDHLEVAAMILYFELMEDDDHSETIPGANELH